ncbi:conserved hypothetical protein [Trichinella spiralis]|uniref:hypothetical protein n=1 Tax=Trichinella spiralis TaxID=6334 RepID=UPI0001EFE5E3|nr:conserved hypothetical protein [Trichinella spiralis]
MKPIAFDCTLSVHRDCSVQDSKLKVLGVISTSSALSLSGGSSTVLSQIGGGGSLQMTVVFSVKMRFRRICDKGVPVGGKMEPNSIASTRQRESEFFNTCLTLPHACFSLTFRHLKVYFLMLLQPSVYGIHRIVKEQPHEAI